MGTALPASAATSTINYLVSAPSTTETASQSGNSIKIDSTSNAVALNLAATTLTTQGGILFVGGNSATISSTNAAQGLKSGNNAATPDFVINNYGTGVTNIQAPIIRPRTGVDTLTIGGTGTTVLGNSAVLATVGTYTGINGHHWRHGAARLWYHRSRCGG